MKPFQLIFFLLLTMNLGACANNSFSASTAQLPSESSLGVPAGEVDNTGAISNSSGSAPFVPDGLYYALEYRQACSDGGPIAIILISSSSSQAAMTRQSCVNLSAPRMLNIQNIQGAVGGLFSHEGLIYINGN